MEKLIHNRFFKILYFALYEVFLSLPYYLFRICPVQKNKIVFCNFDGKGYGDNPKYIGEEIIKHDLKYDLVWLTDSRLKEQFPSNYRVIDIGSTKAIFELVTARIWIDNGRKSFITRKRKNQFYIQTWHACMMIKKVEKDAEDKLPYLYVKSAKNDSKMIDLCISNSSFMTNFFNSSFWYNGDILQCGFPKMDYLINATTEDVMGIKNRLNIDTKSKIVLYAPTFRNNKNIDVYILEFDRLLKCLSNKFGEKWIVLIRLHPSMTERANDFQYSENVVNLSTYSDMQDLLIISDVLITDYSSTMFESYLLNKPVFLYATDVEEYQKERGLYFEFAHLPFPKANNYDNLLKLIEDFDNDKYVEIVSGFMDSIGFDENGEACQQITSKIEDVLNSTIL
jgi:CDP-glycerol glycerophosphotransferase